MNKFNRGDRVEFENNDTYFVGTVGATRAYDRVQVTLDDEYLSGAWNTLECNPDYLTLLP